MMTPVPKQMMMDPAATLTFELAVQPTIYFLRLVCDPRFNGVLMGSYSAYTADEGEELAKHENPSPPKDITQAAGNRERNGRGDRPATGNPQDVVRVSQGLADLVKDTRGEQKPSADRWHIGQAHELDGQCI